MKDQLGVRKVAMIPVRSGSKRVKNKNLRLLGGKPLIYHITNAVIQSKQFRNEDIYINSDSKIFETIARDLGVKFYHRPDWYASDEATNDDFALEFVSNVDTDMLFQFLSTSPFITSKQIKDFVTKMLEQSLDTLISVVPHKIECLYDNAPINFKTLEKTPPSQLLEPIYAYACGLMAWKVDMFKKNMAQHNSAYHGGEGQTGHFTLTGFATVDIDTEDDFDLAEAVYASVHQPYRSSPQYYIPDLHVGVVSEADVPSIIDGDGVSQATYVEANHSVRNIKDILKSKEAPSWIHRVIDSESNSACLICQQPGEGNRRHYHPSWNEWWYIVQGTWDFEIEGQIKSVQTGDFVFIPKNSWHKITATGDKPAIRLAVSREGVDHVYKNEV